MYTSHGHHILGTILDGKRPQIARCGGPRICSKCAVEAARYNRTPIRKKEVTMEFNDFVRKPFIVEAVEVTTDNIEEIAQFVGTLQIKADGSPFIQVDRTKIPNVFRVYPGFWMTRMSDNIRCYSRRVFTEQFVRMAPEVQTGVDQINGPVEGWLASADYRKHLPTEDELIEEAVTVSLDVEE